MSPQEEAKVLAEAARAIGAAQANALKIVIVEHVAASGMLMQLLVRNHQIPKRHVTQLGYTASDEQNAALLKKATPIVIVAKNILVHRPCTFFPPPGAEEAIILDTTGGQLRVSRQPCGKEPFELSTSQ